MMTKHAVTSMALFVVLMSAARSHHNMSAVFDFEQRITRTGTITELDWRNPHIYLWVDAMSGPNEVETWSFEGPTPNFFRSPDNADKIDFENAVGKTVTVEASRARDGSLSGLIRTLTLPDGRVVTMCPNNC